MSVPRATPVCLRDIVACLTASEGANERVSEVPSTSPAQLRRETSAKDVTEIAADLCLHSLL